MATLRKLPVVAGLLALVAVSAALGAGGPGTTTPPRLPWAVPTIAVSSNPVGVALNPVTHTLYVANGGGGTTLSVIDARRCNAQNASRCSTIGSITVGPDPLYVVVDPGTDTIYTSLTGAGTVAVVNGATCNATNTSGCGQTPVAVSFAGGAAGALALDAATHTLYAGTGNEGPVSLVDTSVCNATNATGCGQTPLQTATSGDGIAVDHANHSVYVTDNADSLVSVFDGATCNATNTSGCGQAPASFAVASGPVQAAVDEANDTVYVPIGPYEPNHPGAVVMIDGATCNGTVSSGCATTRYAQVGVYPVDVIVDPATQTVYVLNEESSSISVLNGATCNATTSSGCASPSALAVGFDPAFIELDPRTHTLYASSQAMTDVWVLDAAACNATRSSGCIPFAPTTTTDDGPTGIVADPASHTVYANDREANKVSVIDTRACNAGHLSGCSTAWPEISVGDSPQSNALNPLTHTLYVNNRGEDTLSVIDTATCNATVTAGCGQTPRTTAVGAFPQQEAVNSLTDTVYVANDHDNTVSVVSGALCNAGNTSGCGQTWPTVPVGDSPQGIGLDPLTNTIYVANTNDNTVSVIDGSSCNGTETSGCGQAVATIAVGAAPRSVGIDPGTDTIFVGNRDDGTVSVIDGSTCNGKVISGCGQSPASVSVGTPNTELSLGRAIAFDPVTHLLFVTVIGDSDVAVIDGNVCRGGQTNGCRARIVPLRMGGYGTFATVDTSSGTVYVGNNTQGNVSLFQAGSP